MSWDTIIFIGLVVVVVAALGYVLLSGGGFLISNEEEMVLSDVVEEELPTLPVLGPAPGPMGIVDWINTEPLTDEDLRGKVVLVDFWTYSCINCIRTFPFVRQWHERYKDHGFVLLGVHTPEFDFEKKRDNVVAAMEEHGLTYPVAMDNDYATWRAYNNRYWPAHYLIDVDGNVRYTHFGEGKYGETEQAIQSLLIEGGLTTAEDLSESLQGSEEEEEEDVDSLSAVLTRPGTPELYLGYKRIDQHFGSGQEGVKPDEPFTFMAPVTRERNRWYLDGQWAIGPEASELVGAMGSVLLEYQARMANMVLESAEEQVVEVLVNGAPLTEETRGDDVFIEDGRSLMRVGESRLYNLVNTEQRDWQALELKVTAPGLKAFTYTFG